MRYYEAYDFSSYFLRGFYSIFHYIFGFDGILNTGVEFFAYAQPSPNYGHEYHFRRS